MFKIEPGDLLDAQSIFTSVYSQDQVFLDGQHCPVSKDNPVFEDENLDFLSTAKYRIVEAETDDGIFHAQGLVGRDEKLFDLNGEQVGVSAKCIALRLEQSKEFGIYAGYVILKHAQEVSYTAFSNAYRWLHVVTLFR